MHGKQTALLVPESNSKNPDATVNVGEKDIPKPGRGEVLVRITLRPVRRHIQQGDIKGNPLTYVGRQPDQMHGTGEPIGCVFRAFALRWLQAPDIPGCSWWRGEIVTNGLCIAIHF